MKKHVWTTFVVRSCAFSLHFILICNCCYSGKITYYTQPPEQHTLPSHLSAQIITELSAEFDIEALTSDEKEDIKGRVTLNH